MSYFAKYATIQVFSDPYFPVLGQTPYKPVWLVCGCSVDGLGSFWVLWLAYGWFVDSLLVVWMICGWFRVLKLTNLWRKMTCVFFSKYLSIFWSFTGLELWCIFTRNWFELKLLMFQKQITLGVISALNYS